MQEINWEQVIESMPGVYLSDQYPKGAELALSIEALSNDQWSLHCKKIKNEKLIHTKTKPLAAHDLYLALERHGERLGETPAITDDERRRLSLPDKQSAHQQSMSSQLPGRWIGASDSGVSELGWSLNYSVELKGAGTCWLYSCPAADEDDFAAEPDIERYGPFDLSQTLDELNALGFQPEAYAFLLEIEADGAEAAMRWLPGSAAHIEAPTPLAFSIVAMPGHEWKLFEARPAESSMFHITEHARLDAKSVHKLIVEWTGQPLPDSQRDAAQLPGLEAVFEESLKNKLKGFWLGAVDGVDGRGLAQKRFAAIKKDGERAWLLEWARSEELLSTEKGSRKYPIHRAERIIPEEMLKRLQALEPELDALDMVMRFRESKYPEVEKLGAALLHEIEER